MYIYSDSIYLIRSVGAQWRKDSETDVDLENKSIFDIFSNYSKVYLILTHSIIEGTFYVDMDIFREEYSASNLTLNELLTLNGNNTLEYVSSIPDTAIKYCKFSDAFRAKYKIDTTIIGVASPDNYPVKDKVDLVLTRPGYKTDMGSIHTHCLVSVNGYIHMTDTDGEKAYVYEGGRTKNKSKQSTLGILSFLDIGELTKIQLDPDRILSDTDEGLLKDKIVFSVDEELDNKSYILVLGGYMIFPSENTFWRSGVRTFSLDLNKLPYIERIFESSLYLDLSHLELTEQVIGDNVYSLPELWSDEVIKRYMTMSQSFLVLVDIPNLYTDKVFLKKCNTPGKFTMYQDPILPLILNYGKIAEYWKEYEDGYWSVSVVDNYLRNYIITQQDTQQMIGGNNHLDPMKPFEYSRGYLLNIYGYIT